MDYEGLRTIVNDSGLKHRAIASKMGITDRRFSDLLTGRAPWKVKDVESFCLLMDVSKKQRDTIFFSS
ncbi:MAG: helix-turn-helix domain-containing protein [Clostridia bacterium]|nr:helix-turn-helix domain-containing protein [Clostridia bacterium]